MSVPVRRRTALVTGGTRRIGRAIALRLARDGANMVLVSRQRDADARATLAMLQDIGVEAVHVPADIGSEQGVQAAFDAAAARFGTIDVVVHNAGLRSTTALADMTLAHWREVMAVNLDAAFLCSRAALPLFPPEGGRIVYIMGTAASIGMPKRSHVAASKAALGGLARALAAELADRKITVNCVSPGLIDTEGTASSGALTPAMQNLRIAANRLGKPQEIAAMVALLVSDEGAYITGQVVHVNGGMYYGQ